jgi:hypothetical protein
MEIGCDRFRTCVLQIKVAQMAFLSRAPARPVAARSLPGHCNFQYKKSCHLDFWDV